MKQYLLAVLVLWGAGAAQAQPPWPPPYREPVIRSAETSAPSDLPWTLDELVMRSENPKKARMNGKYRMLMLQFDAPASVKRYGPLCDLGFSLLPDDVSMPPSLPHTPLRGYWVYAAPSWYVWHELATPERATLERATLELPKRDGGEEQALGPPNTTFTGKRCQTAWTSKWPDAPHQWLLLEFAHSMQPRHLQIYESLHPGAIKRITMMANDGSEVEVWSGIEPTRTVKQAGAVFELTLKYQDLNTFLAPFDLNLAPSAAFATNRVKLYFDAVAVAGWHEIDAVALMDDSNIPQWASAALASSSYADANQLPDAELPAALIGGWPSVRLMNSGEITGVQIKGR